MNSRSLERAIRRLRHHLRVNQSFAQQFVLITEKTYYPRGYSADPETLNTMFEAIDGLTIEDTSLLDALVTLRKKIIRFDMQREQHAVLRLLELIDNMALTMGRWGVTN